MCVLISRFLSVCVCVCVCNRERLMRQVLALVTQSHVTTPSSLSVRASSYLVSLPHSALQQQQRSILHALVIHLEAGQILAVMTGTHQTKQSKSWPFIFKNRVEKQIGTHYYFFPLGASRVSIKTRASCH